MSDTTPPAPPAPPSPPAPPHAPRRRRHRRLRRDRSHRVLGGVCAGIARTYGIDIVLVRVLFVIAAIAWIGLPLYLVLWIALPADHDVDDDTEPRDIGLLLALMLIGIGALIFVRHVLPHSWTNGGGLFAPLLLIGGGVAILVLRRPGIGDDGDEDDPFDHDHEHGHDEPIGSAPTPYTAATAAPGESLSPDPTAETTTITDTTTATQPTPTTTQLAPDDDVPPTAWSQTRPWANARSARREHRREWRAQRPRPFLGPLTIAVLMIGAGVASLLEATDAVSVNVAVVLAIGTCIVGAALVVSAWIGRSRGLIALGLVLACAAGLATIIDVPLTGGFGARTYRPLSAEDVQSKYKLGAGTLRLDFNNARWTTSDVEVHAQVGAGELHVNVPGNTNVVVDSHVGAGDIEVFEHIDNGWDVDQHTSSQPTLPGAPTLHLVLRVGAGKISVNS